MEADRELRLVDVRSISEGVWRMAQLAKDAAETLDARIEYGNLDGAGAEARSQDMAVMDKYVSLRITRGIASQIQTTLS